MRIVGKDQHQLWTINHHCVQWAKAHDWFCSSKNIHDNLHAPQLFCISVYDSGNGVAVFYNFKELVQWAGY